VRSFLAAKEITTITMSKTPVFLVAGAVLIGVELAALQLGICHIFNIVLGFHKQNAVRLSKRFVL
jgi:hypothetical protein